MANYNLKFKKKGEKGYWNISIKATKEEDAIKEAEEFIWKKGYIAEGYIEEIIHKAREVWSYKED